MPSSPNSLTITAMRRPSAFWRMWRSSVVLPLPRKPVTTVAGILRVGHGRVLTRPGARAAARRSTRRPPQRGPPATAARSTREGSRRDSSDAAPSITASWTAREAEQVGRERRGSRPDDRFAVRIAVQHAGDRERDPQQRGGCGAAPGHGDTGQHHRSARPAVRTGARRRGRGAAPCRPPRRPRTMRPGRHAASVATRDSTQAAASTKARWSRPMTGWAMPESRPCRKVTGVLPSIAWCAKAGAARRVAARAAAGRRREQVIVGLQGLRPRRPSVVVADASGEVPEPAGARAGPPGCRTPAATEWFRRPVSGLAEWPPAWSHRAAGPLAFPRREAQWLGRRLAREVLVR